MPKYEVEVTAWLPAYIRLYIEAGDTEQVTEKALQEIEELSIGAWEDNGDAEDIELTIEEIKDA